MIDPRLDRRYPSIAHMKQGARRRMPRFAFEYLVGGIGDERCLQRNRMALAQVDLLPRYITAADKPDHTRSLFGRLYDAPFGVAPIGLGGLMWPRAARHLAASARRHNLPFILSTFATDSLEDIRELAGEQAWFQLYVPNDREIERSLIERAQTAGYTVLVITVDIPTVTRRARDIRQGLSVPPRIDWRTVLQASIRPAWLWHTLSAEKLSFKNLDRYAPSGAGLAGVADYLASITEGHVSEETLKRVRDLWPGKLVVKGLLDPRDARHCVDIGVDGIVVSNHGGRQLDAARPALEALPEIRRAVGPDMPLLADGGIRSGLDVARMIASGADFVLLGRAFMYAVAAMGEKGADHVMSMLKEELRASLAQLGCPALDQLPHFRA